GQEVRELSSAAEAVNGVGALLDLRHDPSDEEGREEEEGFTDQQVWRGGYVRGGPRGFGSRRVELVADDVYTDDEGSHERDEDEEAPTGAETVFAEEDRVTSRRRRGWDGFCQRCVMIHGASSWGRSLSLRPDLSRGFRSGPAPMFSIQLPRCQETLEVRPLRFTLHPLPFATLSRSPPQCRSKGPPSPTL